MREEVEVWPVYTCEAVDDHASVGLVCETHELAVKIAAELDGLPDSFGNGGKTLAWASTHPMKLYREVAW